MVKIPTYAQLCFNAVLNQTLTIVSHVMSTPESSTLSDATLEGMIAESSAMCGESVCVCVCACIKKREKLAMQNTV